MATQNYINPGIKTPEYTTHAPVGLQGIWRMEDRDNQQRATEQALSLQELEVAKQQAAMKEYKDNENLRLAQRRNKMQSLNNEYELSKPTHQKMMSDAKFWNRPDVIAAQHGTLKDNLKTEGVIAEMGQYIARSDQKATYFEPAVMAINKYYETQKNPESLQEDVFETKKTAVHAMMQAMSQVAEIDPSKRKKYAEMMKDPDEAMARMAEDFPIWIQSMTTAKERHLALSAAAADAHKITLKGEIDKAIQRLANKGGIAKEVAGRPIAEAIQYEMASGRQVTQEARDILFKAQYLETMDVMSEGLMMSYLYHGGKESLQEYLQEKFPDKDVPVPSMNEYLQFYVLESMKGKSDAPPPNMPQGGPPPGGVTGGQEAPPPRQGGQAGGQVTTDQGHPAQIPLKDGSIWEYKGLNERGEPVYGPQGQ